MNKELQRCFVIEIMKLVCKKNWSSFRLLNMDIIICLYILSKRYRHCYNYYSCPFSECSYSYNNYYNYNNYIYKLIKF